MRNLNKKEITMEKYGYLKGYIGAGKEEYIIEAHKELIGKTCKDEYSEIKDCGMEFIRKLLTNDWGRSIVYEYSEGAKNFMQSKYLSNYLKHNLKKMLGEMNFTSQEKIFYPDEMIRLLNSSKTLNEMTEEEIKYIFNHLKMCMSNKIIKNSVDTKVVKCFNLLLYKLNGKGAVALLKDYNYITKSELANHILLTSGLTDRASYYSGRGVNYSDLSDRNLVAIFKKLMVIDINYALNFVEMVLSMKTIGATEFINSFKDLAENNFNYDALKVSDNNITLDGVYGEQSVAVGLASIFSAINNKDEDYQIRQSDRIKRTFLFDIKPILKEIKIDAKNINLQSRDSFYKILEKRY